MATEFPLCRLGISPYLARRPLPAGVPRYGSTVWLTFKISISSEGCISELARCPPEIQPMARLHAWPCVDLPPSRTGFQKEKSGCGPHRQMTNSLLLDLPASPGLILFLLPSFRPFALMAPAPGRTRQGQVPAAPSLLKRPSAPALVPPVRHFSPRGRPAHF